ncbi:hypothetical protein C9374_007457 [Naegleria lovaniensis]|uniref:Uncharacterized protein n=1 Tax=Naegleria lovaniensis TaxID=51637 RepID=A0AA88KIW3_NAELO|nr:uncharacterized protein C9374_007457 [Naegleria lovaniensis]KAG2379318.1 hypothetical protein C9374_007457 [Naegleria lovaniensis]
MTDPYINLSAETNQRMDTTEDTMITSSESKNISEQLPISNVDEEDLADDEEDDEELIEEDDDMEDDFLDDDSEDGDVEVVIQQDEAPLESNIMDDRIVLPTTETFEKDDILSTHHEEEETITTITNDLIDENQNDDEIATTLETTETATTTGQEIPTTSSSSSANQSCFSALVSAFLKGKQNIVAEKEESLAKNIYSTALNFHSKGDFNTAIDYYNRLLNREFIANAVSEKVDEYAYFDIKSNVFLYLKFLALKNLGSAFMSIQKFLEASICLAKALAIDASDVSLWYDYAVSSITINDLSTARLALEQTLIINPNHHLATMQLLELLYIIGDVEECNILSKQILKYDPHNKAAQFIHSECNPNPFNLIFFSTSPLNDLTRKWTMFACPGVEQESPKLYRITLKELDWTNILTRVCSLYSNLLKQGQLDSIVKLVYERPSQISTDNAETTPLSADGESSQNGKRKRTFVEKLQTPSKFSKQMSGVAKDIFNIVTFSEHAKNDITYRNEKAENCVVTCDELPNINLHQMLEPVVVKPVLELMRILTEKLTRDCWTYKWPEVVVKGVCFSAFSLMKHKIELSFECKLCVAEILCGSYEKDTSTEINLSKARRIFSNMEAQLLSSRNSLNITPTNVIRLLWVRGVIDQHMGNSPSAKKWLDQCLTKFQEFSSQEILLPNCNKNNKINQDSIHRKLNEMSFNKKVDLMSKLVTQHQYFQALSNISREFLISLPSGARSTVKELLYKSLKHIDSLESISYDTLLHILHFLLADVTKQTIENVNLKPFKALLPKVVKKVSSTEDLNHDVAEIVAMKVLIILEVEFFVTRKDESDVLSLTYLVELFYYLATFQSNTKRKEYLQLIRKKLFPDMKKRIKPFLVFMLKEFYNLLKQVPEKSNEKTALLHEVSVSIYYLYGKFIPLTEHESLPKTAPFQGAQESIEKDKDTCLLLFNTIDEFLESRLEKTTKVRKQIPEVLAMICNAFNTLPEEAQSAKLEITRVIDDETVDLDNPITIPTVLFNDNVKVLYEKCFYFLSVYKNKSITTENIFDVADEYSECVYLLRKSVCCKPMDFSYWDALSEKYWKILQFMFAVADSPAIRESFQFKEASVRANIGLPEEVSSFKSDLESIIFKCLHCLQVCLQLASKNDEVYSINLKLGQLLFDMLDCTKILDGQLSLLENRKKSYFANHCFQYLESAAKIDKRDSQILFLMARIREKFHAPSSEYLPLYLSALKATPPRNPRMENIYFYYVLSLLNILQDDQNNNIEEKYLYQIDVDTSAIITAPDVKCPIINNLPINNPSTNLKIWTSLLSGVQDVLKLFPSSFRYAYLVAKILKSKQGPWASKKAAEEVLASVISKKENKQMPPTIEFHSKYEFGPTIEKRHQREWKASTLSLFLEILASNRNIEYLLFIIYWLKHNLLERDKHLFSLYPEVLYYASKTLTSIHTEKPSQDLIPYAVPIYCYISDLANKDQQLANAHGAIKTLLEKHPKTKDLMTSKQAEKKLREFYEKEYLVDIVKFKKVEKKDDKESKSEKKKEKKTKDKTESKTKKDMKKEDKKKEGKTKKKDKTESKDKTPEKKKKKSKNEKKSEVASSSSSTTSTTTTTTIEQIQFHMETPTKKKKKNQDEKSSSVMTATNNTLISTPPSKSQSNNSNHTTPPGKGLIFHHFQPQASSTQKSSLSSKKPSPSSSSGLKSLVETSFSLPLGLFPPQPSSTRLGSDIASSSSVISGESLPIAPITSASSASNNKSHLSQILSPPRKEPSKSSATSPEKSSFVSEDVIIVSDSDSE